MIFITLKLNSNPTAQNLKFLFQTLYGLVCEIKYWVPSHLEFPF